MKNDYPKKNDYPNWIVFRHIIDHAPITALAIAAGLDLDTALVERALATLLDEGRLIGIAGHDPDGAPLYTTIQT